MAYPIRHLLREDRIIPGLFIAFFVGLACVEAAFIIISVRSFTGLSEADPYRRGIRYNETIEARTRDLALGWRVEIGFAAKGRLAGDVSVILLDRDDQPLKSPAITAAAHRVTTAPHVIPVDLENRNPSTALGHVTFSEPGRWFIKVRIEADGHEIERIREIMVEGP